MKVIEVNGYGNIDVLCVGSRNIPNPGKQEVLIKVIAAGINRPDIFQRKGLYSPPAGASDILGLEVSGEIVSGDLDNSDFSIGDKVCALLTGGGYAEYCIAHIHNCLPIPKNVSFEEAAGLPEVLFTVWNNIINIGNLSSGESFLVHGGSSGIGTMAVQLAKSMGCLVYATAGSDKKVKAVESLGALKCINYKNEDFVKQILDLTDMKGVNLILDMVAGDYLQRNIKVLSDSGRMVMIALLGGSRANLYCVDILRKNLTISGSMLRSKSNLFKSRIASALRKVVWPLLEKRIIVPITYAYFPLDQVSKAHAMMESGEHIGKIILRI
ncbi:MAG: NAD(P)H-quinone oxidoreductase [Candidatus Kinetoplastibacterium crithidii]|nr:MAG: NAD(P)H-quinone oxidoreductase [Candidatus Kinetoplastibacterium crithidii]